MDNPTVSVCIPTYNGEKYIEKAIKSILMQTYKNFELLIIDDASIDKTVDIICGFKDTRVRLLKNNKNMGMVSNWNRCLVEAKGELIQFVCHDDYLKSDCLEKKINIFNSDNKINLVFNATCIVNGKNEVVLKRRPFNSNKLFDGNKISLKSFKSRNFFGEPSNVMFRKDVIEEIGYFDSNLQYSIDWDYWIKICLVGNVYYLDELLTYFRVSDTSATNSLMKSKSIIIQDDNQFIKNCLNNNNLKLSLNDVIVHKFNIRCRTCFRSVFYKFVILRNKMVKNETYY